MRVIYLPTIWTIVLDSIAWATIQPGIAYLSLRFPAAVLEHRLWPYRTRAWERGGAIYDQLFRVKAWKARLPSGGGMLGGFSMTRMVSHDVAHLERWVLETCRSELCHWVAIAPALLFFLWNPPAVGIVMIVYALAFNLPLVIVQRRNRPRLLALIKRRKRLSGRTGAQGPVQV